MSIPKTLSTNPYEILLPDDRWRPGEQMLQEVSLQHLLPPLVDKIRREVRTWRDEGYPDISETSRALLRWWFCRSAESLASGFRYYFAQREAVESVIYLYEKKQVRDKVDLLRFDSGNISAQMMEENWRRFVIKMATGSGKTKVIALLIIWSYFHKTYEEYSELSRNILLIAPNIIVLDRLRHDFEGKRALYEDSALPETGYEGRNWQADFQLRVHIQDEVRGGSGRTTGNLYLTNIHRVYYGEREPTMDDEDSRDYFLGERARDIRESTVDLADIVRDTDELLIINDEAHHIHDPRMAWFRAIQSIHNLLVQKDKTLSLQLDLTATPKHNNGVIFPQTISDYPLVEAIHQNVVKRPVVPDDESVAKLKEHQHPRYSEQYADFIELGVKEWRKARNEHKKANKKAVLFIMTDNTRNCDELAEYLQTKYSDLEGKVLVIHTKNNGDISESALAKKEQELQELRKNAAEIDSPDNKYSAVVSVLVLREGWNVRNVTTIVGLRAYSAKSNILPEQTLGRGLRLMYEASAEEKVSVIGSPAFVEFVKQIEKEGVKLERVQMGELTSPQAPLIVAIDRDNKEKNISALDFAVPVLSRRFSSDWKTVFELCPENISVEPAQYKKYDNNAESREITFCDILTGRISHRTNLGDGLAQDYSNVIAYFTRQVMNNFNFFSNYDYFYELTERFVCERLFGEIVPLDATDTMRNLAETPTAKKLLDAMFAAIATAIRKETDNVKIQGEVRVSQMRAFAVKQQKFYSPCKSAQNCITNGNNLELSFARFLDSCADVAAFAKNYFAVNFYLEYVKANGELSRYFPDFFVKDNSGKIWIVETKGRKDENDIRKLARLAQWRKDVAEQPQALFIGCLLVDDDVFRKNRFRTFAELAETCPLAESAAGAGGIV